MSGSGHLAGLIRFTVQSETNEGFFYKETWCVEESIIESAFVSAEVTISSF